MASSLVRQSLMRSVRSVISKRVPNADRTRCQPRTNPMMFFTPQCSLRTRPFYPTSSWTQDTRSQDTSDTFQKVFSPDEVLQTEEDLRTQEIIGLVDDQIAEQSYGRLFAILYFNGQQKKVTTGDLILIQTDFGCEIGSQLVLDKVIMVGGRDFSLIGRPVLPRDLVEVVATVVEKNLAKTNVNYLMGKTLKRKRIEFERPKETVLRINRIQLLCPIEEAKDRSGFEMKQQNPTEVFK